MVDRYYGSVDRYKGLEKFIFMSHANALPYIQTNDGWSILFA